MQSLSPFRIFAGGTWCLVYHLNTSSCLSAALSQIVLIHGKPDSMPTWYMDGPPITHLSFPVRRCRAAMGCEKCKYFCAGHYQVKCVDVTALVYSQPSGVLKREFSKLGRVTLWRKMCLL